MLLAAPCPGTGRAGASCTGQVFCILSGVGCQHPQARHAKRAPDQLPFIPSPEVEVSKATTTMEWSHGPPGCSEARIGPTRLVVN